MRAGVLPLLLFPAYAITASGDDLQAFVASEKERLEIPGISIALIDHGAVSYFSLGVRNADANGDVSSRDVFDSGSISKTVTAWAIMSLAEQGLVSLDTPVENYIGARWRFPPSEFDSGAVTLRRILSHTAGLTPPSYQGVPWGSAPFSMEDSLNGYPLRSSAVRIVEEPGTAYRYSGGGYTIAKLVVESVTGEPYADYIAREILDPLGMSTATFLTIGQEPLAVSPHDYSGRPISDYRMVEQGAGGMRVSAEDLASFLLANMRPNPVLSEAAVDEMHAAVIRIDEEVSATLGFERRGGLLSHGGTNRGWVAQIDFRPASGSGLVILTNSANGRHFIPRVRCKWSELFGIGELAAYCEQRRRSESVTFRVMAVVSGGFLLLAFWLAGRALRGIRSGVAGLSFDRSRVLRSLPFLLGAGAIWGVLGTELGVYVASGVRWGLPTIGYFSPPVRYMALAATVFLLVLAATSLVSSRAGSDDASTSTR